MPETGPHSFDAVTGPPNGAVITFAQVGCGTGLQPKSMVWPQLANTGGVTTVQLNVRVHVLVRPQAETVKVKT